MGLLTRLMSAARPDNGIEHLSPEARRPRSKSSAIWQKMKGSKAKQPKQKGASPSLSSTPKHVATPPQVHELEASFLNMHPNKMERPLIELISDPPQHAAAPSQAHALQPPSTYVQPDKVVFASPSKLERPPLPALRSTPAKPDPVPPKQKATKPKVSLRYARSERREPDVAPLALRRKYTPAPSARSGSSYPEWGIIHLDEIHKRRADPAPAYPPNAPPTSEPNCFGKPEITYLDDLWNPRTWPSSSKSASKSTTTTTTTTAPAPGPSGSLPDKSMASGTTTNPLNTNYFNIYDDDDDLYY